MLHASGPARLLGEPRPQSICTASAWKREGRNPRPRGSSYRSVCLRACGTACPPLRLRVFERLPLHKKERCSTRLPPQLDTPAALPCGCSTMQKWDGTHWGRGVEDATDRRFNTPCFWSGTRPIASVITSKRYILSPLHSLCGSVYQGLF